MTALSAWWSRLPRDARDSFFLLGVIAAVLLPHAGHLPPWATASSWLPCTAMAPSPTAVATRSSSSASARSFAPIANAGTDTAITAPG